MGFSLARIDLISFVIPLFSAAYKTTTILLDGKKVKLQVWDTSGQGRFCTILRSYSRGAQGILLIYDITNKWSFDGLDRWLHEVEEVRQFQQSIITLPNCLTYQLILWMISMHLVFQKFWLGTDCILNSRDKFL